MFVRVTDALVLLVAWPRPPVSSVRRRTLFLKPRSTRDLVAVQGGHADVAVAVAGIAASAVASFHLPCARCCRILSMERAGEAGYDDEQK